MVDLSVAKRWTGSSWVDIPLPGDEEDLALSATISRDYIAAVFQVPVGSTAVTLNTVDVVVTATGGDGAGPTYQWTQVSGSPGIDALSPTSATTKFRATLTKNTTRSGMFRCTVTRGAESVHVFITVEFEYIVGTPE
jgi:hypothetical protein